MLDSINVSTTYKFTLIAYSYQILGKPNAYFSFSNKGNKSRLRKEKEMKLTMLSVCFVFVNVLCVFVCHKFSPVNSPREIISPTLKIRKLSLEDKVKLRVKPRAVCN